MLDFAKTRILESIEAVVATGFTVTSEGSALVADYTAGVFGVKPATGGANDRFYGVALAQQLTLTAVPKYESFVPTGTTITLAETPISGTLRVYNSTEGNVLAAGNPATTDNEYSISGKVITLHSSETNDTIIVTYRFAPTTLQAQTIQGDIPPGGAAALTLGSVGVVVKGQVATTEFDTSVDWNQANPVLKLAANGIFTLGGSGVEVPNAVITQLPGADSMVLVFEI